MINSPYARHELEQYIARLRAERDLARSLRAAAEIGTVIEEVSRLIAALPPALRR